MTYVLPNTIQNGDDFDATPVQGNFASLANEVNNHDTRITTNESDITTLQAESGGWKDSAILTYSVAGTDAPSFVVTAAQDQTQKIHEGTRIQGTQPVSIQNYFTFNTDRTDSKGSASVSNIGTPTYTAGKFSNALTLNGTDQALSITDSATLHLGDASHLGFTVGKYIKTSNTGSIKTIFQSYSTNGGNAQGISLIIAADNCLYFQLGNNTSVTPVNIHGATNVCDGSQHYVAYTLNSQGYGQIYLDGKLEASGYLGIPVYNATNYVRIGVSCYTGTSVAGTWFNGQIDDLFIAAHALDEQTIYAKYVAGTAQGTGDITVTKNFLCTKSVYANPTTTITLYGGTDYTLTNTTFSSAKYSNQKAPDDFPVNPDKWMVEFSKYGSFDNTASTTGGVWYNYQNIAVPIGSWMLSYEASPQFTKVGGGDLKCTLSTTNNGETKPVFTSGVTNTTTVVNAQMSKSRPIKVSSKTTFYLNVMSTVAADNIYFRSDISPTVIRALSALI